MKHFSRLAVSATLSLGMIVGAGGVALASGHGNSGNQNSQGQGSTHKATPAPLTGTVTCNVHGTITIGTNGYVRIHANFTPKKHTAACAISGGLQGQAITSLRVGHLNISAGSRSTPTTTVTSTVSACAPLPSGTVGALSNGTAMWQPRKKVAASTGISFASGSVTTTTSNNLQFAFVQGAVTGGSFITSDAAALTLTSRASVTALNAQCHAEFWVIPVTGTVTL